VSADASIDEFVYQFIRKGGRLPVYARWIERERTRK
jgi:hypothetical protein